MSNQNLTADEFKSYLASHNITEYKEKGAEISFPCPFNSCDDDRRSNEEYHCNFNINKQVYNCFKCEEDGHLTDLRKHFGDYKPKQTTKKKARKSLYDKAISYNKALPEEYRKYFNGRGINDESIDKYKLGYGEIDGKYWLTIPVFSDTNTVEYFKLRQLPGSSSNGPKYKVHPAGKETILVGSDELQQDSTGDVFICEGELDRIVAIQNGITIPVITGGGANIFKDKWVKYISDMRNIYICLDRDEVGIKATDSLVSRFEKEALNASIFTIELPEELGDKGDLSDYFLKYPDSGNDIIDIRKKFVGGVAPIDSSKFEEMSVEQLNKVLDTTIKKDDVNKVVTFLAMLLTYTEEDQLNIIYSASSSTGKTYICTEVSKYFPKKDVKVYGKVTPTAFYYTDGSNDDDSERYIDLERKILIFTEQPDTQLLANLRSFLSHDDKRTPFALTNKGKNGANKTQEGYILGFSSTFFCTAFARMDEQEMTRSIILSPESNQVKLEASLDNIFEEGSNPEEYAGKISSDEIRQQLKDRVEYVKRQNIKYIKIADTEYLKEKFISQLNILKPKDQRDAQHFISLVKGVALLNCKFRMDDNNNVVANNSDIDAAYGLWKYFAESRKYGVPPQVFDIYKKVILAAWKNKHGGRILDQNEGITIDELSSYVFKNSEDSLDIDRYKRTYIPTLQSAGLISYEQAAKGDKRKKVILPLVMLDKEGDL